jgi:hypothetical protein
MTQQERNVEIVNMLGWIKKGNLYAPSVNDFFVEELTFHSDWNWLMEAVEFVEKLGYESLLGSSEYYYPGKGMRHIQSFIKDNITIYQESKDKKEAVFIAVSDFAKQYNNKEL